jgi:hypothetical protein
LLVPIALATQFEFWGQVAEASEPNLRQAAERLLAESQPVAEADLASWIDGDDPWADTFALWLLTGYPRAHRRLRDMTFALAVRYGQIATRDGLVLGSRHPFFAQPLASASAQLALSLWRLGIYPTLLPQLVDFVRRSQRADGGWADGAQPSDILTTLVASELLTQLDPAFDPTPATRFAEQHQEAAGWWRALNPEVPWLTSAVVAWMERARLPFVERFRWPDLPIWSRDRTTRLPTMAVFDELAVALAGIPGLAETETETAFIDLAGFGQFNNRFGMEAGDAALAAYAAALNQIPNALVIRQGGDELLVLGVPGASGVLEPQLRRFMTDWQESAEAAGVPRGSVVPRILLASGPARELRSLRGRLGTAIGLLKKAAADPGPIGVLMWL